MAYEALDWVWTPDESTPYNYTSNLATMASSIENRVGRYVYYAEGTATPTQTSNFAPWLPGNVISCTRIGRLVTVQGQWKCTTTSYLNTNSEDRIFGRLPVGFRPKVSTYQAAVGSGSNIWIAGAKPNGDLIGMRSLQAHNNNFLMNFTLTYLAED